MADIQWNPDNLDLTTCDREPIHIPGSVQPHGVLFVLHEPDYRIVQVSDNTGAVIGTPPDTLLDKPLAVLVGEETVGRIRWAKPLGELNPLSIMIGGQPFNAVLHCTPGKRLVFEIEPAPPDGMSAVSLYHAIQRATRRLQSAESIPALCQIAAEEIRRVNGFDRVMIYQFDENWNGSVVAEDKIDALEPFLGLRYPASDIPKQARALYKQTPLRLIRTVTYEPAQMLSIEDNPAPLDMSFAQLRSVSPIHLEYMRNMGVSASMSISLLKDGDLWGLVACHHTAPRFVSYDVRAACELLGQLFAVQLAEKEKALLQAKQARANDVLNQLVEFMSRGEGESFVSGLMDEQPNILDLVDASGAAVYNEGRCYTIGQTPEPDDIRAIVAWLWRNESRNLFHTHALALREPAFERLKATASGVLAICISRVQGDYVLWFLPEQIETVHWGGDPNKRAHVDETSGETRVSPRQSFEAWQEVVALRSRRWQAWEIDVVTRLRTTILDTVLRLAGELRLRASILARLNDELARSNDELDSFAYIASHDLKEPLRGIHTYARFLLEDYGDTLPPDGTDKLKTLVRLSQRMEGLLDSLLHFSRVGRLDLTIAPTDLHKIACDVVDLLKPRLEEMGVSVRVNPLPTLVCDSVRVGEVFNNLITNAMKYNDKDEKWIEIGEADGAIYVRDNGIGIPPDKHDDVFQIFKRLHGRDQYSGGSGVGLTIVKKIVERHNGRIWIESTLGEGTTFYFTLDAP